MSKPLKTFINSIDYKLIQNEKNPKRPLTFKYVYNAIENSFSGTVQRQQCEIDDNNRGIRYRLLINETPVPTVFTILLMFDLNKNNKWTKLNHYHLMRFDFVGNKNSRHINNYGTKHESYVYGNHVHIMVPPDKNSPKKAIPIGDINEFKNLKAIKDAFYSFLKINNVKIKYRGGNSNG